MKKSVSDRRSVLLALIAACVLVGAMAVCLIMGKGGAVAYVTLAYGALEIFIAGYALKNGAFIGYWTGALCVAGAGLLMVFACLIDTYTFAWWLLIAISGMLGGVITHRAAEERDHNGVIWFVAGFVCLPLALAAAMCLRLRARTQGITPGRLSPLSGNRLFGAVEPWLYLAPFLLGLIVFTLYPVVNVVFLSFKQDYNHLTREFVGWSTSNYEYVLNDKYFSQALRNTMVYVVTVVPISTAIAVVIAYLLNQKLKGSGIFQTAFFLPMVTSVTAVGLVWKLMYNKNFGIINYALSWFGIDAINWLDNSDWRVCLAALVIFGVWNILPFTIILLLSGLQNIDEQYYTAAKIDGAKGARIFFRITVPLLAPTIFLVCIVNTISSFKVFSELYPLFKGKPGPYNNLYTVVYYIRYAMMTNREYGIAAAAAIVLFLFIFCFTMIQMYVQKRMSRRTG